MAKKKSTKSAGAGLTKLYATSEALSRIVGRRTITRPEMTSKIWDYIRSEELQDDGDRRIINPDRTLASVLGSEPISMFDMQKALNKHLKAL